MIIHESFKMEDNLSRCLWVYIKLYLILFHPLIFLFQTFLCATLWVEEQRCVNVRLGKAKSDERFKQDIFA